MIKVKLRPHTASKTTDTFKWKFKPTINKNVRPVCLGPIRHPFDKRRSTQHHHRHCSVFGQHTMRVSLPSHTVLDDDNTAKLEHKRIQQCKRTRCSLVLANPITVSCIKNKRRSTQSHHRHCSAFGQQNDACGQNYDLILCQTPINNTFKCDHTRTKQYKRTRC